MKHILVVADQTIFGQGLQSLLRQEPNVVVDGCRPQLNAVLDRIDEIHPDVIICDADDVDAAFPNELIAAAGRWPRMTIVTLSLNDNRMSVLSGEHRTVEKVQDLLEPMKF